MKRRKYVAYVVILIMLSMSILSSTAGAAPAELSEQLIPLPAEPAAFELAENSREDVNPQEEEQKDFVLRNESTGKVVGWNLGQEVALVGSLRILGTGDSPNNPPPVEPHTLTLNKDLELPMNITLANGPSLTIQSAEGQVFSITLKEPSHATPVSEEIIEVGSEDGLPAVLNLRNLILDGQGVSRGLYVKQNSTATIVNCTFKNCQSISEQVKGGMAIQKSPRMD